MNNIRYYLATITTQYDGLEWKSLAVTTAGTIKKARKKIEEYDFTHKYTNEVQEVTDINEISNIEYAVLSRFLLIIY